MREIITKVYEYDELSETAQKRAFEEWSKSDYYGDWLFCRNDDLWAEVCNAAEGLGFEADTIASYGATISSRWSTPTAWEWDGVYDQFIVCNDDFNAAVNELDRLHAAYVSADERGDEEFASLVEDEFAAAYEKYANEVERGIHRFWNINDYPTYEEECERFQAEVDWMCIEFYEDGRIYYQD